MKDHLGNIHDDACDMRHGTLPDHNQCNQKGLVERLTAEVAALKEQLAAREAREVELREALDNLVASIIPTHKTFKHGNESIYVLAEQAQKLLSHSTGSKIKEKP